MKVEVECCEGSEKYRDQCLRRKCPIYKEAEHEVDRRWPYMGTGFGNAYGNPGHGHYLEQVKEDIAHPRPIEWDEEMDDQTDYK